MEGEGAGRSLLTRAISLTSVQFLSDLLQGAYALCQRVVFWVCAFCLCFFFVIGDDQHYHVRTVNDVTITSNVSNNIVICYH